MYTYHKYRKSIDSQVPLDLHGNPISEEDREGSGVALDLGYIHEGARFSAEEAQPLAPPSPPLPGGQRAYRAVRDLLFNALTLHKAEFLLNVGPSRSDR